MVKRRPISHLVALVIAAPLLAASALLLVLSWRTSERVASRLEDTILDGVVTNIRTQVTNYLENAQRLSDLYIRRIGDGTLATSDLRAWAPLMVADLVTSRHVDSVCFADAGDPDTAAPESRRTTWLMRVDGGLELGQVGPEGVRTILVDEKNGLQQEIGGRQTRYAAAERPWYSLAMSSPEPIWTPPYAWFTEDRRQTRQQVGIGYTRRVTDRAGRLIGILVVDVTLDELSRALRDLPITRSAPIFIVEGDGTLVAASHGEVFTADHRRLPLSLTVHSAGRSLAEELERRRERLSDMSTSRQLRIQTAAGPSRAVIQPLAVLPGIDWRIVTVGPDELFVGEARRGAQRGLLWAGAAALALGAGLVLWLTRSITRPVRAVTEHVRRVAGGDYSAKLGPQSSREMQSLADELGTMAADLAQREALRRELRDSEERYRTIVLQSPEAILVYDVDARCIAECNPAAERLLGLAREQIVGRTVTELSPPTQPNGLPSRELLLQFREQAMKGTITEFDWIFLQHRPNLEPGTVVGHVMLVMHTSGGRQLVRATIVDVTARRQAEEQVRHLNATLERRVADRTRQLQVTNEELESFTYTVSHDLRAPLRHIHGFVQLLERHLSTREPDGGDEKSRRYLTTIADSARQMGQLIDDLLAFSRVGRTAIEVVETDMQSLVNEVISRISGAAPHRTIDWLVEELPPARADRALIRQVWTNLLDNAAKYTAGRDPARIEIGSRQEGDEVVYFIKDNGAGFDPRYAHKLFGVFQRLHSDTEFPGTGIGLASVRRIVNRHGGRVWAEGRVGEGAVFSFSLPRIPERDTWTI